MSQSIKERILQTLIETRHLRQSDIDDAIALQKRRGISLDQALVEKGLVDEKDLMALLVGELHIPFINLAKYRIDPGLKESLPENVARQYKIIPLSELETTLTIATSDPLNIFLIDDIKNITGKDIDVVMSTNTEINRAIDLYYGGPNQASVTEITKDIDVGDFEIVSESDGNEDIDGSIDESAKAPIVRMVNLIVKEAIKQRASDIHIEPMQEGVRVRYRIDGVLRDILELPKEIRTQSWFGSKLCPGWILPPILFHRMGGLR